MAPLVGEWHGADISENMLGLARTRAAGLQNVFLHHLGEVGLGVFAEDSFDFVYATTVFMHLDKEDLFQYLVEARRVLKPAHLAYFDTWNLLHPDTYRQWRSGQATNRGPVKSRGRIQFCTASELRCYLDDVGFAIERLDEDKLLRAWCRKVPVRQHLPNDALPPFGYVDLPKNESAVRSPLVIQGWALDDVERIEVTLDRQQPLACGSVGLPRLDLAPLFPRYPGAANAGFCIEVTLPRELTGHHTLQVVAVDRGERRTDLTGEYLGISVEPMV